MFNSPQPEGGFAPPGILKLSAMNVNLTDAIGYAGGPESIYPYRGEKPGGTDVGHLVDVNNETFIVKTGITLSLLAQAVENVVAGKREKADKYLGVFILGNYTRIAGVNDIELNTELKTKILAAFDQYLQSEQGQALQAMVKKGHKINTHDVYQIYLSLTQYDAALVDVLGLPAFADVVSGSHSQQFNNVFQLTQGNDVAAHKLLMQPRNMPGIYQGSTLVSDSTPFDKFLLDAFLSTPKLEDQSVEDWTKQCKEELVARLKEQSLAGLCSGILTRHILGESADNGPDNMILTKKGVVNIDLTGFRYPRKDEFRGALGWADTLAQNSADELLPRLFHETVFKNRFIQYSPLADELKAPAHQAIVVALQEAVQDVVVEEVAALRNWLASMNPELVNRNLAQATKDVHSNLGDSVKFSTANLEIITSFNQQFITQAVEVAKASKLAIEAQPTVSLL